MTDAPPDIDALRAALAAAEARADAMTAEAMRAKAMVSGNEAMIALLKLEIEKLRRALYGHRSERKARLLDQLELQLEEIEASATKDDLAAEQAAAKAKTAHAATRRHPVRKPFPEHLPRERVVIEPPCSCGTCGSDRIVKLGEDGEPLCRHVFETNGERDAGGHSPPLEGDPDRAREVHLPGLREDHPAAIRHRARTDGARWLIAGGSDAVPTASDAVSMAEGHRGDRPAAAACACERRRSLPLPLP